MGDPNSMFPPEAEQHNNEDEIQRAIQASMAQAQTDGVPMHSLTEEEDLERIIEMSKQNK